jgi:hypothetical protein
MSQPISHKPVHSPLLLLCIAVLLAGSSHRAYADCSQGGCPKGQRCVGDGKSPILKCVPEPRLSIITPNGPMASDPVVDVNAPPQQPNCYKDSDCRAGYTCNKGGLEPNSPEYASLHGDCGRVPPACRTDQDCLSDEYCEHSELINNATGAVCSERPVAKN